MVRLLGLNLPDDKRVEYALTFFYGIGWKTAEKILDETKIDKSKQIKQLTEDEIKKIIAVIEKNYQVEGELREELAMNTKRLRETGSYRGTRQAHGLPVRGQRTRSNARTKRGKRKTVGALKKEVWAKLDQSRPETDRGSSTTAGQK